jgi:hypothetical protein
MHWTEAATLTEGQDAGLQEKNPALTRRIKFRL